MRLAMLLICSIALAGCARGLLPDAPPDPAITASIQASVDQARTEAVACIHKNVPRFASGPDAATDICRHNRSRSLSVMVCCTVIPANNTSTVMPSALHKRSKTVRGIDRVPFS